MTTTEPTETFFSAQFRMNGTWITGYSRCKSREDAAEKAELLRSGSNKPRVRIREFRVYDQEI